MTITFLVEVTLEILLATTLCYCILLERRLAAVRKGQEGLSRTIGELNMAIAGAGASLRALKSAAGEAAQTLDERLKRARLYIDELSVLTASGERIAVRMEDAAAPRPLTENPAMPRGRAERSGNQDIVPPRGPDDRNLPSSSIMSRLDSMRTAQ
jgi:Domain of unknown function (DUF6468)